MTEDSSNIVSQTSAQIPPGAAPVSFWYAFAPVLCLILLLIGCVAIFGDDATGGPSQVALMLAGFVAAVFALASGSTWAGLERQVLRSVRARPDRTVLSRAGRSPHCGMCRPGFAPVPAARCARESAGDDSRCSGHPGDRASACDGPAGFRAEAERAGLLLERRLSVPGPVQAVRVLARPVQPWFVL